MNMGPYRTSSATGYSNVKWDYVTWNIPLRWWLFPAHSGGSTSPRRKYQGKESIVPKKFILAITTFKETLPDTLVPTCPLSLRDPKKSQLAAEFPNSLSSLVRTWKKTQPVSRQCSWSPEGKNERCGNMSKMSDLQTFLANETAWFSGKAIHLWGAVI